MMLFRKWLGLDGFIGGVWNVFRDETLGFWGHRRKILGFRLAHSHTGKNGFGPSELAALTLLGFRVRGFSL